MGLDFYYVLGSSPCRSVLVTAKAVGVDLNLKPTNLQAGEHLKPEYIKLNPQHTVPTLDDNGFALWESRAICIYLQDKYGKDPSLYPTDPQVRATVNRFLFFDMNLYERFGQYCYPQVFAKQPANPEKLVELEKGLAFLDGFLAGKQWAAGTEKYTLADIALLTTITTVEVSNYVDLGKYGNIKAWLERCKQIPGYDVNVEGAAAFKKFFD